MAPGHDLKRRMADFEARCRRAGIRMTPQRLEIYRELARTEKHPDAETVFKRVRRRMPTVSLDTVYRTLCLFEERGIVSRVDVLCNRARYDANADRHHHFVCRQCGLVRDFYSEAADRFAPPAEVRGWGDLDAVLVQVRGTCTSCRRRGKAK